MTTSYAPFATYSTKYDLNARLTSGATVDGYFVLQNLPYAGDNNRVSLLELDIDVSADPYVSLPDSRATSFNYNYNLVNSIDPTVLLTLGAVEIADQPGTSYTTYTYQLLSTVITGEGGDYGPAYSTLSLHFRSVVDNEQRVSVSLLVDSDAWANLSYDAYNDTGDELAEVQVPFDLSYIDTKIVAFASDIVCYAKGTLILTARGPVRVEKLKPSELILTVSGKYEPLKWLGFREIDCKRHSNPTEAYPVRILKNAFGFNQPERDLYLSPLHSVYVDGILIPAVDLVNGVNVLQERCSKITYFHVELPTHNAIYAEGLTAETYLDDNNRDFFSDVSADSLTDIDSDAQFSEKQFPDQTSAEIWAAKGFATVLRDGPQVDLVKARLLRNVSDIPLEFNVVDFEERMAA
jgi:hypothetical protein